MTELQTTTRLLSTGDTLELGDVIESSIEQHQGGSVKFIAVYDGETVEYAVLTARFEDGESIDVPDDAQILAVKDGNQRANPVAWMLVPVSEYGSDAE